MQYDAVVSDRPALAGIGKRDGFQIDGGGDILGLPQRTTVCGAQNRAIFACNPAGIGINKEDRGEIGCGLAILPAPAALSPGLGHTRPADQEGKE